ncbi:MAG: metal-sulfur cluster assembly factor [Gemmatimonadota bacterium]|jgi:metal-sulfur cluster biosynthetic enzyme
MIDETTVRKALRNVKDPELNLDVVVLGLVYDLDIQDDHVHMRMSLTSPMCPVADMLVDQARQVLEGVEGVKSAEVELTFDPPWTPERMDPMVRATLGL